MSAATATSTTTEVAPMEDVFVFPASYAQQRLWFIDQLEPGSAVYNVPAAVRLSGELSVPVLGRALQEIARRHEVLRTVFAVRDGEPVQEVRAEANLPLELIDLSGLGEGEREAAAREYAGREAREAFDLSRGPLVRARLLRLEATEHVLLLTLHHIVSDGWSMGILVRELTALYQAYLNGRPSPLGELAIQYADYAVWQREWLSGAVLEGQLEYWRGALEGVPRLELPADRARPAASVHRGASIEWGLDAETTRELKAFSQREGATLFMSLLAAFQVLMGRYSGQSDFAVGTPIAGRNREETEGLIGFFVNTLVLRADLSGEPSFREVLGRVRERVLGAYAHQDVPFEKLVEKLAPERDLSHSPLFQVMLVVQNTPQEDVRLGSLRVAPVPNGDAASKFELTLSIAEEGARLAGAVAFDSGLYSAAFVERLLRHFTAAIRTFVADPDQSVYAWPWLDATEREQLLDSWNDTMEDFPSGLVHERVAAYALSTPDAPAVVYEGQTLTYAQLDGRASKLAAKLRQLGVGPEVAVATFLNRSLDAVVAILGTWKAGGAYVPLDPAHPQERLAHMLEDSGARVTLTSHGLLSKLPPSVSRVVCVEDVGADETGKLSTESSNPESSRENVGYIVYTSGSTGRPKGVAVEHRSIANYVSAVASRIGFGRDQAYAWMSTVAADLGNTTLLTALAAGGSLHVIGEDLARDSESLQDYFESNGIDVVKVAPTHWSALCTRQMPRRRLILGGETSRWEQVERWRRLRPECQIWNHYGPTECTVGATCFAAGAGHPERQGAIALGQPLGNVRAYVLDPRQELVPVGIPGELYIGGAGLARGYLGQPALTAERFVPSPFDSEPGSRLYRTGDKVRWRADGNLEFLGRLDQQVKIRGHRIELSEIEAVVSRLDGVHQCAAIVSATANGDQRLAVYVVPGNGEALDTGRLRERMRESLPDYMVPSAVVTLESLPLMANGKLDRRALPAPPFGGSEDCDEPRTAIEEELCLIWMAVLGLERIGVHDNFFDLGGDSFLAIKMVALAGQKGARISVRQLFQHQSIRSLAAVAAVKVELEDADVAGPIPIAPIQRALLDESTAPELYHQSLIFESTTQPCASGLHRACEAVLAHHDALRLVFEGETARTASGERNVFVHADFSALSRSAREHALQNATRDLQRFRLSAGPLIRAALFSGFDTGTPSRLLIAAHHMTIDAVSWRILVEDLQSAYTQAERGEPIQLPARTTSWRKWVEALAGYAQSEPVRAELSYWTSAERAAVTPLPRDYKPSPAGVGDRQSVSAEFDAEATTWLLRGLPKAYGVEIQNAILTAVMDAFTRWTGSARCLVNMRSHGREELGDGIDVSRTLGWFTSIVPVLLRAEDGELRDRLASVRRQVRSIPAGGIGYGALRYLSADPEIAAQLRRMPTAEIGFNYLGRLEQQGREDGAFKLTSQTEGELKGELGVLIPLIGIACAILDQRLQVTWFYRKRAHRKKTIEGLVKSFQRSLTGIVEESRESPSGALAARTLFL